MFEQISTAVAAMPMPNAAVTDVEMASVGQVPSTSTSVGFSLMRPLRKFCILVMSARLLYRVVSLERVEHAVFIRGRGDGRAGDRVHAVQRGIFAGVLVGVLGIGRLPAERLGLARHVERLTAENVSVRADRAHDLDRSVEALALDGEDVAERLAAGVQAAVGAHDGLGQVAGVELFKLRGVLDDRPPGRLLARRAVGRGDGRREGIDDRERGRGHKTDDDQHDDAFDDVLFLLPHALTPPNGSVRVQREIYGVRMFINRMANDTPSEYEPHTRMRTVRRPQPKPKITRPQFVEGVVE